VRLIGCNCGKTAAAKKFVYTAPDGQIKVYPTEIEAKAAVIRQGGSFAVK